MFESLWGEEFEVPKKAERKAKVKEIAEKISNPKSAALDAEKAVKKQVKSKSISLLDKLAIIKAEVLRVLGNQVDNIVVIKTREELHNYISQSIANNRISIDTETNNSLDPITCKLMGPCIYTPNQKQAYIPINHRDPITKERLSWQLTEKDIEEEFLRLIVANTFTIMHNGKFDYQVIKCTCNGIELHIDWDTLIGAKLLDENEKSAGLKDQYIDKIDSDQEKYSIDHLFEGVEYADVDPEIFALYAAHDAGMTDRLQLWQENKFRDPSLAKVFNLFKTIEMPLVKVIAEMELAGMEVDMQYAELLSAKFHKQLNKIDTAIAAELDKLKPQIDAWRLTKEANYKPVLGRTKTIDGISYKYDASNEVPVGISYWYEAKSGRQLSEIEADTLGLIATAQKSKNEQLTDPINLASPTQLAILFYDVLKCPIVNKKTPRGTGEDELKEIAKKLNISFCDLLLERRECVKLLTTYIDAIPELSKRWPDKRVRTHFNQYGAATGRLSSSDPINF